MNMKSKRDSLYQEAVLNAWSELSGDFQWTENLLEHYQDKLDWHKISSNRNIFWTIPMVQKFRNSIDWDIFSLNAGAECLTEKFINAFKDDWNWSNLADNYYLEISYELLDKFVDKWDWKRIIARFHYHDSRFFCERGFEFLERYQQYISMDDIKCSRLWCEIVRQQKKRLIAEMTS